MLFVFTLVHVAISLVAIAAGFVVMIGMIGGRRLDGWTAFFLTTTVLTSVTGFGFPFEKLLPSHVFGIISLIVLAVAIYALYGCRLAGRWRTAYVVGALVAQYLNVFVLVFQSFLKIPFLKALAPTQSEAPFAVAQLAVLVAFIVLSIRAEKGFRAAPAPTVKGGG